MRLEDIGFYTLEDSRALNVNEKSPLWRCELLVTGDCNFKCPYCRGPRHEGNLYIYDAIKTINWWLEDGLKNIRFSGGEPTLYPHLEFLVKYCKQQKVEHIAISTNGSAELDYYKKLIDRGVNDFSISLDACCAKFGDMMTGRLGTWEKVVSNIKELSKLTYVTAGVVYTKETQNNLKDVINFADELGVADIRILSSAQFDSKVDLDIDQNILDKHSILKYRINNFKKGRRVRGIKESDCHRCHLVKDDMASSGGYHYPCIIHLREGGNPIGKIGYNMRQERIEWFKNHNSFEDPICRKNCLDVCIDYNNKVEEINAFKVDKKED